MFISPLIVAMRLFWFRKHMSRHGMSVDLSLHPNPRIARHSTLIGSLLILRPEARRSPRHLTAEDVEENRVDLDKSTQLDAPSDYSSPKAPSRKEPLRDQRDTALTTSGNAVPGSSQSLHVTHAAELPRPSEHQGDGALYVPPPRERDRGKPTLASQRCPFQPATDSRHPGQPIVELTRSNTHLADHGMIILRHASHVVARFTLALTHLS